MAVAPHAYHDSIATSSSASDGASGTSNEGPWLGVECSWKRRSRRGAAAEEVGVKLGADAKVLSSVINTSSGRCWSSEVYNPVPGVLPGTRPESSRE